MHELPLLINISVALTAAFFGGLVARRLGLPPIVGYMLAGVAIGPFTPGFVGDTETISQLAELGVIFLMFGVGLHFSFRDLWQVRDIAIPGALGQMALATLLGLGLTRLWGWPVSAGLVLGLAISVASTVVLLRGLMDNGLLNTRHGRVAVGWLVLEDLATVLILVALPVLAATGGEGIWQETGLTLLKAGAFVGIMLLIGSRLVPWLLLRIAYTRSRELFILAILATALGTAFGSAELFGVSLALGAFLAGVVLSESPLSHQVAVEVLPFREAFAVLFFVSVGMLVNPAYLLANAGQVAALTALIVLGKAIIAALLGFLFPHPARTALVVAVGLSQIGEFSFIVGQAGLRLGLLDLDQYALVLAGSLISITLNPFMFRLIGPVEAAFRRFPSLWRRLDRHGPAPVQAGEFLSGHVVVVGWGRVGHHIVDVLGHISVPRLVVEADAGRVEELGRHNIPTLFGDVANSELLNHAGLDHARALVITLPDEAATETVVAAARQLAPQLPIIARAATQTGVERLARLGAHDVIHPELEGGLEIVRHTLLHLGLPAHEVQRYADALRREHYSVEINTREEHRLLHQLMEAVHTIDIRWCDLTEGSPLVGQTLAQAEIRARTGASVVIILRDGKLMPNPKSQTVFQEGDKIGLIGDPAQIVAAESLMVPELSADQRDVQTA
ncbi:MAG: cation:proton antiporter [Anaerolineales bacterium]